MFRVRDLFAEAWLKTKSLATGRTIQPERHDEVKEILSQAMADGRNPKSAAVDLVGRIDRATGKRVGGSVELNDEGKRNVAAFEHCLRTLSDDYFKLPDRDARFDKSFNVMVRNGSTAPEERIQKLVNLYESKLLKIQADTVARTEMMRALAASEWASIQKALANGNISEQDLTKEWQTAKDDIVRHSHRLLDGVSIPINEPFVSPVTGAKMRYPGDVDLGAPSEETENCRCRVRYKVDWFARRKRLLNLD